MENILKATAKSPANIAFIKYWGKKNEKLKTPLNNSISMNLSNVYTITTVEFSSKYKKDTFALQNELATKEEIKKVSNHLNRIREKAGVSYRARVVSVNNFPKSTGLSSSASGFSALTVAACKAAGLDLSEKEISRLARIGSGSACRSIPDGFVEWKTGNHKNSYAYSLFSSKYWQIYDVVAIVSREKKKVGSTLGQSFAQTSPFLKTRLKDIPKKAKLMKQYIKNKNFSAFGKLSEKEALNMHAVMITSTPSLLYWTPNTLKLIKLVQKWRREDLESYFIINTGQDVHILTQNQDLKTLLKKLKQLKFIKKLIINKSSAGARIINKHLF